MHETMCDRRDTWIVNFAESNHVDKICMDIVVGSSWDILFVFLLGTG